MLVTDSTLRTMADIPPDLTGSTEDTASTPRWGEGAEVTRDLTEEILNQWMSCGYYIRINLDKIVPTLS